MVTPLESVKTNVPLPPVVFLVTTTERRAALGETHDVEPPVVTTAVQLVEPTGVKSALADSLTVYVPGARPVKVADPEPAIVVPLVEIVAVMVTPLESVNTNVPLPPVVFLVTTTEPSASLAKLQLVLATPAVTTAGQLVEPTGTKPGVASS